MELKYGWQDDPMPPTVSSNRTFMELKWVIECNLSRTSLF